MPSKAVAMPPRELHMLLSLVVAADEQMLSKQSVKPALLNALLVAYAKDGEKPRVGGTKKDLVARVAEAVRAGGIGGFARPPVFGDGDSAADTPVDGGGEEEDGVQRADQEGPGGRPEAPLPAKPNAPKAKAKAKAKAPKPKQKQAAQEVAATD